MTRHEAYNQARLWYRFDFRIHKDALKRYLLVSGSPGDKGINHHGHVFDSLPYLVEEAQNNWEQHGMKPLHVYDLDDNARPLEMTADRREVFLVEVKSGL